ncbi:aspartate/glutamate racemase family protein [Brachybacterium phenoliresistens]|uniref:aspartate/glutamate racemase family protein n=1 Tax=Brachybacterium phenoliresistens TaxID=396014 RepID=UPI0031CEB00C
MSAGPGGRIAPEDWSAQVVGVLGGLGPAATSVFLDILVRATDAASDQDHLDLLVSQHSTTPDRTARILDPAAPDPGIVIARDARMLERAGATLLVMPCNTAHHFVRQAEDATTAPFLSIVELTAEVAARRVGAPASAGAGASAGGGAAAPVAVFATEGNVRAEVYQQALEQAGARAWIPSRDLQDRVNAIIYDQVKAGRPVDMEMFEGCVAEAIDGGAGTVVLGCTELSVVYDQQGLRGDPRLTDSLTELATATILAAGKQVSPAFRPA